MTLILKVNRQGQVIYFEFSEISEIKNVKINTKIHPLRIIITSFVMNGQVEESSTWNIKVIRLGHVIYFNIFGIYNLDYVENDTNLITLSHLLH